MCVFACARARVCVRDRDRNSEGPLLFFVCLFVYLFVCLFVCLLVGWLVGWLVG